MNSLNDRPNPQTAQNTPATEPAAIGLPVRTNLRAGVSWDEVSGEAAALWEQFTSSIQSAVSGESAEA